MPSLYVYYIFRKLFKHSVALVCGINQCSVTICILHYINLLFLLCLCPYSQFYCIVLLCPFCVPCHSAPCRALPWNLNWLPPIKISSHKLQALWTMSQLLNAIIFFKSQPMNPSINWERCYNGSEDLPIIQNKHTTMIRKCYAFLFLTFMSISSNFNAKFDVSALRKLWHYRHMS